MPVVPTNIVSKSVHPENAQIAGHFLEPDGDVRSRYRKLSKELTENFDGYTDPKSTLVSQALEIESDLYQYVTTRRDESIASSFFNTLSSVEEIKVTSIVSEHQAHSAGDLVAVLKGSFGQFDENNRFSGIRWDELGQAAAHYTKIFPALVDFCSLETVEPPEPRAATRRRKVRNDEQEVSPETLDTEKLSKLERTETSKRTEILYKRLSDSGGTKLEDFVVDPTAFSNSVENLFDLAFLVRDGEVSISPSKEGLELNTTAPPSDDVPKKQAIFSFDLAMWERLRC